MRTLAQAGLLVTLCTISAISQSSGFPWVERFDTLALLPPGWAATGFSISTSSPHTPPRCLSSMGNTAERSVTSSPVDLRRRIPLNLTFWERRSATASAYRLEVNALTEQGSARLALFDGISVLSAYVERSVVVDGHGLEDKPNVRFQWCILPDATNSTGVVKIDDIGLTSAAWQDLALGEVRVSPSAPDRRTPLECIVTLRNVGRVAIASAAVTFVAGSSRSGIFRRDPCQRRATGPILSGDSCSLEVRLPSVPAGELIVGASLEAPGDEEPSNDTLTTSVPVGSVPGDLAINELLFAPMEGDAEWVEFMNTSPDTMDLAGWTVRDAPTASGHVNVFELSGPLPPGGYVVLASDSSIFRRYPDLRTSGASVVIVNRSEGLGLTNDGDAVVLDDPLGMRIDSVCYSPSWHHPDLLTTNGRSLERVNPLLPGNDPRNWSSCASAAGATPGRRNSTFLAEPRSDGSISISPNPFSPDGDGYEDRAVIRYRLSCPNSIMNIRIFDLRGRLVRWLANAELAGSDGLIVWDGMNDRRERLPIGPYILLFQASNTSLGMDLTKKALVVIAKHL